MSKIPLTQGRVAIVSNADFPELIKHKWFYHAGTGYACRNIKRDDGSRTMVYMHKVIRPGLEYVDHQNTNRLDNRRSNLRRCTNQENARNQKISIRNKSGFKGVSWSKQNKKWYAYIGSRAWNKKTISLGFFDDPRQAASAYNKAAEQYFGEFARLNEGI